MPRRSLECKALANATTLARVQRRVLAARPARHLALPDGLAYATTICRARSIGSSNDASGSMTPEDSLRRASGDIYERPICSAIVTDPCSYLRLLALTLGSSIATGLVEAHPPSLPLTDRVAGRRPGTSASSPCRRMSVSANRGRPKISPSLARETAGMSISPVAQQSP